MSFNLMTPTNVMVDLETLGTRPGCVILSIGAATFAGPPDSDIYSFYARISAESCYHRELISDPATVKWWQEQDPTAREEAFSGTQDLKQVLFEFNSYLTQFPSVQLWANGADFDFPILRAAYDACGLDIPWKYNCVNDYRTLKKLFEKVKSPVENKLKHSAYADAVYQAAHCEHILKRITQCQS